MNSQDSRQRCSVREVELERGVRALRLENELLAATVLVDKGADLYELRFKPRDVDVLWKSPWGLKRPGSVAVPLNSMVTWLEHYPGGWQVLFPNGGAPCTYQGVELTFHGEASLLAWDVAGVVEGDEAAEVRLRARLVRSPFLLERTLQVAAGSPVLTVRERVTNQGGETLDYMWSHHPAYGAPFLSGACRIDTNARSLWADDLYESPASPLVPDAAYAWPLAERDGTTVDLSVVPAAGTPRSLMGYFGDYTDDAAWYAVTNRELGLGIGLVWPRAAFPYAWFWQEMQASSGDSSHQGIYVLAIEPATTIPGQGLVVAMEKTGTHRTLAPGATAEVELRAVFYEAATGVERIGLDGAVSVREGSTN